MKYAASNAKNDFIYDYTINKYYCTIVLSINETYIFWSQLNWSNDIALIA